MSPTIVQCYKDCHHVCYTGGFRILEEWGHNRHGRGKKKESQSSVFQIGYGSGLHVSFLSGKFAKQNKRQFAKVRYLSANEHQNQILGISTIVRASL